MRQQGFLLNLEVGVSTIFLQRPPALRREMDLLTIFFTSSRLAMSSFPSTWYFPSLPFSDSCLTVRFLDHECDVVKQLVHNRFPLLIRVFQQLSQLSSFLFSNFLSQSSSSPRDVHDLQAGVIQLVREPGAVAPSKHDHPFINGVRIVIILRFTRKCWPFQRELMA